MFEDIISSLSGSLKGLAETNPLSSVSPFRGGVGSGASPFSPALSGKSPFSGNFNVRSPFGGGFNPIASPFRNPFSGGGGSPFGGNPFSGLGGYNPWKPTVSPFPASQPKGDTTFAGGAGIPDSVTRWADKTRQTFGDLLDPDIMLAVMTNESGGDPNAYNAAGDAYGLFQQVGLGSYDPDTQFAAAKKLAQDKLVAIKQAYAANGLRPDARTQARDFALAWAGHFDYQTGKPNPTSRDIGSGQTAEQLAAIFLKNYDAIKAARTVGANVPNNTVGVGLSRIWGGLDVPITQDFGETDYSRANPYNYGADFGQGSGHHGLDIGLKAGSKLYSPVSGTVVLAGNTGYYTSTGSNPSTSGEIRIELDNGHILILGHTSQVNVRVGQRVRAGDFVGLSGTNNGDHLHLEYRIRDTSLNSGWRAVDPRSYLK